MQLIDQLTRAADEEQLLLQPLPPHSAVGQEEHLRRHYALLLAALLATQPQVSEAQNRLFLLLLHSLQLSDIRAALFEEARALENDTLLETARLVRTADLAGNLLLDTLILLRLDAPLSDEGVRVVGELAAFLGVDAADVQMRAGNAAEILGLVEASANKLAGLWPEYMPRRLTAEALEKGLQGGLWLLDADLSVNCAWQATDAILAFAPGVTLHTDNHKGKVSIKQCQLYQPQLNFVGAGSVVLESCSFDGDYIESGIALKSTNVAVMANNCNFSTRNTCTFSITGAGFEISDCKFSDCGSENSLAGAIYYKSENSSPSIQKCKFENCTGTKAGALWMFYLIGISGCEFISCKSTGINGVNNIAVYTSNQTQGGPALTECSFRDCSLNIGNAYYNTGMIFVKNSQFHNGNLYYNNKYSKNTIHSNCVFNGGKEIEKAI